MVLNMHLLGNSYEFFAAGAPAAAAKEAAPAAAAKKEFLVMEAAGVVRRSNSPWAAPLHMVKKQDGSWRPCGFWQHLSAR